MNTHATASGWIDLNQFEQTYPYSRWQAWYWISEGRFPVYRPTKRKVLLRRSEVDRFLESKRVTPDLDAIVDEVVAEVRRGSDNVAATLSRSAGAARP